MLSAQSLLGDVINTKIKCAVPYDIITQMSIYGDIVYFLLSHESLNYCPGNSIQLFHACL